MKVNPLDAEAREYAGQILNALRGADWNAAFNTSTVEQPLTMNDGLCFQTTGENSVDPKHNPKALLEVVFRNAEILVNCSGSTGGGDYKLFVLVGHRPLVVGNHEPVLSRVGRWIASLSR